MKNIDNKEIKYKVEIRKEMNNLNYHMKIIIIIV